MPPTHYEISSYDCQMLNPNYNPASATLAGSGAAESKGSGPLNISMLLTVSGSVRYGESRDLPNRVFSETFVLVPNEQMQQGRKDPRQKKYLIQCQNFRLVVWRWGWNGQIGIISAKMREKKRHDETKESQPVRPSSGWNVDNRKIIAEVYRVQPSKSNKEKEEEIIMQLKPPLTFTL